MTPYRQYANIAKRKGLGQHRYPTVAKARKKLHSMECQVPPGELEDFQRVWGEDAPRRCLECNKELPADAPHKDFCSDECKDSRVIGAIYIAEIRPPQGTWGQQDGLEMVAYRI